MCAVGAVSFSVGTVGLAGAAAASSAAASHCVPWQGLVDVAGKLALGNNGLSGVLRYVVNEPSVLQETYNFTAVREPPSQQHICDFTFALEHAGALTLLSFCAPSDFMKVAATARFVGHQGLVLSKRARQRLVDLYGLAPCFDQPACEPMEWGTRLLTLRNTCQWSYRFPLHEAAEKGHLEKTWAGLQLGYEVDGKDCYGLSPLHYAANTGYLNVCRLLTKAGANVELACGGSTCRSGWRPLHFAAHAGHHDVLKLLLQVGASVVATDGCGRSPIAHARSQEHVDLLLGDSFKSQ